MKKYKRQISEAEQYMYYKDDYIKKGLSYFKSMIFDVYADLIGTKDISKFNIVIGETKVEVDGLAFISAITSKQEFKGTYQGKDCINGIIIIESNAKEAISNISIIGSSIFPSKHEYKIKLR